MPHSPTSPARDAQIVTDSIMDTVNKRLRLEHAINEALRVEATKMQDTIPDQGVHVFMLYPHYSTGQAPGVACQWPRRPNA
jgi:hypothetical protein